MTTHHAVRNLLSDHPVKVLSIERLSPATCLFYLIHNRKDDEYPSKGVTVDMDRINLSQIQLRSQIQRLLRCLK